MKCSSAGARDHQRSKFLHFYIVILFFFVFGLIPSITAQIAARYPNDVGIRNDPAVIYATGFESSNWQNLDFPTNTNFTYLGGTDTQARPQWSNQQSHSGSGSLSYKQLAGTNKPYGLTVMGFAGLDEIYMRWYRKYQDGYKWGCQSSKNNGVYAVADPNNAEACVQPNGYDKFSFRVQDERHTKDGNDFYGALYSYQPHADNGGCGAWYSQNQGRIKYQQPGKWYLYEIYIKANTPGKSDGVIKEWVDGELRGEQGGMELRYTGTLKINQVYLYGATGGCNTPYTQSVWDDDLVVAKAYIGPMVTSARPEPPTNLQYDIK